MVFVPLIDDNPRRAIRFPIVSWSIVFACLAVYLVFQSGLIVDANQRATLAFGMIPAVLMDRAVLPPGLAVLPAWMTLFTEMFLHGDVLHLLGNMLFLLVFADNIEDAMGHWRFLVFILVCALMSSLAHALAFPDSQAPLIGASGAISGVVGAYLILFPRVKLWVLLFARIPVRVTTFWIIGGWLVVQVASGVFGADDAVAWWAHVGGFLTGIGLLPLLKRRGIPLFGKAVETV